MSVLQQLQIIPGLGLFYFGYILFVVQLFRLMNPTCKMDCFFEDYLGSWVAILFWSAIFFPVGAGYSIMWYDTTTDNPASSFWVIPGLIICLSGPLVCFGTPPPWGFAISGILTFFGVLFLIARKMGEESRDYTRASPRDQKKEAVEVLKKICPYFRYSFSGGGTVWHDTSCKFSQITPSPPCQCLLYREPQCEPMGYWPKLERIYGSKNKDEDRK